MIHLNAGLDRNGNPRRVYVQYDANGILIGAWAEGYQGHNAVPREYRNAAKYAPMIPTTPKFYREILRQAAALEREKAAAR